MVLRRLLWNGVQIIPVFCHRLSYEECATGTSLCRSLPLSVVRVSCGEAGFTRRHTPGGPLPDLAQRLRVEDRPPAHREGPTLNQDQDVAVCGALLRPALGSRLGLPSTVPLAEPWCSSPPQEHAPERIRDSTHTLISPPACRCTTATILPPFGHLALMTPPCCLCALSAVGARLAGGEVASGPCGRADVLLSCLARARRPAGAPAAN